MKIMAMAGAAVLGTVAMAATAQSDALHVRDAMKTAVNPAILGIWDITNNAMSDDGGIDPALMDDAKWATVESRAQELAQISDAMAAATTLSAAAPHDQAVDEGAVSMADVQRFIDSDPDAFRAFAKAQADHARKLATAAGARDAAVAGELVAGLDGVCENCHSRFWYPEQ